MTGHSTWLCWYLQLLRLPTVSYLPQNGVQQPRTFRSMPIVAKRPPISETAELVFAFMDIFTVDIFTVDLTVHHGDGGDRDRSSTSAK